MEVSRRVCHFGLTKPLCESLVSKVGRVERFEVKGYIDSVANKLGGALAASLFGLATHHKSTVVHTDSGAAVESSRYAAGAGMLACLVWTWVAFSLAEAHVALPMLPEKRLPAKSVAATQHV